MLTPSKASISATITYQLRYLINNDHLLDHYQGILGVVPCLTFARTHRMHPRGASPWRESNTADALRLDQTHSHINNTYETLIAERFNVFEAHTPPTISNLCR